MNIHLHIERVILHGFALESGEAATVRAGLEAELGRLLLEHGMTPGLARGGARAGLSGGQIRWGPGETPARLGEEIAAAVHGGIRP